VVDIVPNTLRTNTLATANTTQVPAQAAPQSLALNSAQTQQRAPVNTQALLNRLSIGETLTAQVAAIKPLNSEHQQPLKNSNPGLVAQLQQGLKTARDSTTAGTTNLPNLSLLTLTTQRQSLLAITTQPVALGAQLQLKKESSQRLSFTFLQAPAKTNTTPAIEQAFSANQPNTSKQALMASVVALLKQALPNQQSVTQSLQTSQILQRLPSNVLSQLLSPAIVTTVKHLQQHSYSPTANNSHHLKAALQSSGLFSENLLQKHVAKNTTISTPASDLKSMLLKAQHTLQRVLSISTNTPTSTSHTSTHDTKGHIDNTLTKLDQLVLNSLKEAGTYRPIPQVTHTPSLSSSQYPGISALFQLLGIPSTPAVRHFHAQSQPSLHELKRIINQQLLAQIDGVLAKLQVNQLKSLGLEATVFESKTPAQQFFIELPLRWQDQYYPLQLTIKEHIEEEANTHQHNDSSTQRRWQVFMSFDLPNEEQLHSQLTLIEERVSAVLWAESSSLCAKANNELATLRAALQSKGLEVKDLQCIHGKPPQDNVSLGYNLIDIKT